MTKAESAASVGSGDRENVAPRRAPVSRDAGARMLLNSALASAGVRDPLFFDALEAELRNKLWRADGHAQCLDALIAWRRIWPSNPSIRG